MELTISKRGLAAGCCALLLAAGCGDSDDGGTDPGPRGDFSVMTSSTGPELDRDGYEISVDGIFAAIIGPNDSVEFANRAVNTYVVELSQVAANCAVAGDNPRPVLVIADSSTGTTFEVTCVGTEGVLQVITATEGQALDDSYTLAVDGVDAGTMAANDTLRTADLETGEHTVRLGDIALNCRLVGDPERDVLVPSEDTIETTYELLCTDQVGNLRLETSTTGVLLDPDGYEVMIEFAEPVAVLPNSVRTVGGVAAGVTTVRLLESSLAGNCAVQGTNPRSVTVPAGGLVSTSFDVTCSVP